MLRRVLNLAGPTVASEIRGDIQASVETRPLYAEDFVDHGGVPFSAYVLVPAVAAQYGFAWLRGDNTGQFDVVVTRVLVAGVSVQLSIGNSTTWGIVAGGNVVPMDSRWDFSSVLPNVILSYASNAAPGGQPTTAFIPAGMVWQDVDRGLVILRAVTVGNAAACALVAGTVNTAFYASFHGYLVPTDMSRY